MATAQLRKRPRADDLSQDRRPSKKIKSTDKPRYRNFPPEFWDSLSKVPLTRRALRELDRRNSAQRTQEPAAPGVHTTDRVRFARHGGPDLRHLRGYSEPKGVDRTMAASSSASSSRPSKSTQSTRPTPTTSRRSSAYDKAFEQHLNNNNIYLHGRKSKPGNDVDLHQPRPSLSPSKFSDGAFEHFQDEHDHLGSEGDVMRKIIPVISGSTDIPNSGDVLFNNMESVTDGATVDAKPDFYDGAYLSEIDAAVTEDLNSLIIPSDTNAPRRPAAPNFFLAAKAPWGGPDVAKRQAGLDGAIGARAMHALQNYGDDEPGFDGNAYSYSSTYHAGTGTLQLYTDHVTAPTAPGGRPEYHMTQIDSWAMTGNIDSFRRGATAFRNTRDLAQGQRDMFIQAANTRARQPGTAAPPEAETMVTEIQQYEESAEFENCEEYVSLDTAGPEHYATSQDFDEAPAPLQYLDAVDEEPSQESTSLGPEPAMSFATSVTLSFSAQDRTTSKRNRASNSPQSKSQQHKKRDSTKKHKR